MANSVNEKAKKIVSKFIYKLAKHITLNMRSIKLYKCLSKAVFMFKYNAYYTKDYKSKIEKIWDRNVKEIFIELKAKIKELGLEVVSINPLKLILIRNNFIIKCFFHRKQAYYKELDFYFEAKKSFPDKLFQGFTR